MDITKLTINSLRTMLDAKEVTALEVTEQFIKRCEQLNPKYNFFNVITANLAREQAKAADERLATGESTPLLGIPYTMKDIYCTKGVPTTSSSNVLKGYKPPYDATIYTRLKELGAVLLGKTNCDAWGHGSSTENSDFGKTLNPWNPGYVPGGSSGGSGAAVAASCGVFSIAEDTGGSIRQPASFNSCSGLKVTYGRISRYGALTYASSLDTVGPIAQNVEDCEIVLECLSGEDPADATTLKEPYRRTKIDPKRKFTIGLPQEFYIDGLDPVVRQKINDAIDVFTKQGVEFKNINIPTSKYAVSAYYLVAPSETSSNLARYDGIRFANPRSAFGREAKQRICLGTLALSPDLYDETYKKAREVFALLTEEFNQAFEEVDAILGPVAPTPPFKFGSKTSSPLEMFLEDAYTVLINPMGVPSLALQCGFSPNGLPIGMQLISKRQDEATLFALGKMYQEHTDWHTQKPRIEL